MDGALLSGSEAATRDCEELDTDSRGIEGGRVTLRSFGMSDFSVAWLVDMVLRGWMVAR